MKFEMYDAWTSQFFTVDEPNVRKAINWFRKRQKRFPDEIINEKGHSYRIEIYGKKYEVR